MHTSHHLLFPALHFSGAYIQYTEMPFTPKSADHMPHTHDGCEIYIHCSGNVSFMVEKCIYPIRPGSVIIARPQEVHHCISHPHQGIHRYFCIQFPPQDQEDILSLFSKQPIQCQNFIQLTEDALAEVQQLGNALLSASGGTIQEFSLFLRLLALLEQGEFPAPDKGTSLLSSDVKLALDYIYENLSFPISIEKLAALAHVSINTLERHFLSSFQMTPTEFIRQRRISKAKIMLKNGASVLEACQGCGFSDYSHFISLFKKQTGMTPWQYKKL